MRVPGAGRLAGLSPRRRVFVVGSTLAVAAVAAAAGLKGAGAFAGPAPRPVPASPGTVVLVPGYGGSTTGLNVLAAWIRRTGRATEVVRLPGNGTGDLAAQAVLLNGYVTRALRRGNGPVDVVGFSAGGVVARLWDAEDGGARKADRIITLGSPLNGTRIAAAGNAADPAACPVACQELVPGSTLLSQLRRIPLTRAARLAVAVDPGRPGGQAADLGPAGRGGQRPAAGGVPERGDRARSAADRSAGHRDRAERARPRAADHAARGGLLDAAGARQRARPAAVIRGRAGGRHAMMEAEGPTREGRRPCPDRFRPVIFITCGSP